MLSRAECLTKDLPVGVVVPTIQPGQHRFVDEAAARKGEKVTRATSLPTM